MRALIRNAWKDRSGAALVEAAFVAPVLITLGFGIFDFSNFFYQHQAVVSGVRDAARYLARSFCATADPSVDPAISCNTQIADAEQIAVYGDMGGTAPRVSNWSTKDVTVTFTAIDNPIDPATGDPTYRGGDPIYVVTVSTSFPYAEIGFLTMFGLADPNFAVSHSERVVGG